MGTDPSVRSTAGSGRRRNVRFRAKGQDLVATHRGRCAWVPSVRFPPLSCSLFQAPGMTHRGSVSSSFSWPRLSRAGDTILRRRLILL